MIQIVFYCFVHVAGAAITPPQQEPAWEYIRFRNGAEMVELIADLIEDDRALSFRCGKYRYKPEPAI